MSIVITHFWLDRRADRRSVVDGRCTRYQIRIYLYVISPDSSAVYAAK